MKDNPKESPDLSASSEQLLNTARSHFAKIYDHLPKDQVQKGVSDGYIGDMYVTAFHPTGGPLQIIHKDVRYIVGNAMEDGSGGYIDVHDKDGNRNIATIGYTLDQDYRDEQYLGEVSEQELGEFEALLKRVIDAIA